MLYFLFCSLRFKDLNVGYVRNNNNKQRDWIKIFINQTQVGE